MRTHFTTTLSSTFLMNIISNVNAVNHAHLLQSHSLVRTEISYTATHWVCVITRREICVNFSFYCCVNTPRSTCCIYKRWVRIALCPVGKTGVDMVYGERVATQYLWSFWVMFVYYVSLKFTDEGPCKKVKQLVCKSLLL